MPPEFMKLMEDWSGYTQVSEARGSGSEYEHQLAEVMDLLSNAKGFPRHRRDYLVREALTTSDFPLLFGDVLDRQLMAAYKAVDPAWKAFTKMRTVQDFRTAYWFATYGGDNYLAQVSEKGEYPASPRDELRYTIAVLKYGRQFDISWEAMVNDDLGALRDTPERFARAALRTEHRTVTTLYASDVGAHVEGAGGNLYQVGVNCVASGTGLLTIANLETGIETMRQFTDIGGEPILAPPKFLVVGPALEMTARQILSSATKMWTESAGGAATAYPTTNVVSGMGLTLIVDDYLPVINTGNDSATQWYLFADPNDIAALGAAHLSGHEAPEIAMKNSDKVSLSGAPITPFSGDFATDNVFYRVREVFGATKLDWRGTYMGGYII